MEIFNSELFILRIKELFGNATQKEIANNLKIDQTTVSRLLRGGESAKYRYALSNISVLPCNR